jgi:hypothetical protein
MDGVTIPPTPDGDARPLRTTNGPAALRRDEIAVIELLRERGKTEPLKLASERSVDDQVTSGGRAA